MFFCIGKRTIYHAVSVFSLVLLAFGLFWGFRLQTDQPLAVAAANYEWGLSFQEENQPPVPNLSAEKLAPYDAYYYYPQTAQKTLYLTFDCGYENGNMPAILDALKKHNAQGAFFVVGPYIEQNPELVKRMAAEGHIVGNHSWHHPNMTTKSQAEFQKELADVEAVYKQVVGTDMPKFYRPPEGKFSDENLTWAQQLGYRTVFWSLAYVDWKVDAQPTKEQAFEKILPRTHDGAIVLLHSTSSTNAQILDELLTTWEEQGYHFGSLYDLGKQQEGQAR